MATREDTSPSAHLFARPLRHCPGCGSERLEAVIDVEGESVNFLCADCGRCWHVELGYVQRVDPASCGGCPHHPECAEVFAADHPVTTH
jgi:hypothetical protein